MKSKKISKEEHILSVATELFLKEGYGNVSMDKVALTAKVSKPTIYVKFKNKEELFLAVMREYRHKNAVHLPSVEEEKFTSKEEILKEFFSQTIDYFSNKGVIDIIRLVIAEIPRFPQLNDYYKAFVPVPIMEMLTEILSEKPFCHQDAEVLATQLLDIIKGQTIWKSLFPGFLTEKNVSKNEIIEQAFKAYLKLSRVSSF